MNESTMKIIIITVASVLAATFFLASALHFSQQIAARQLRQQTELAQ